MTIGWRRWLARVALGGILVIAAWLRIVAVEETVVYHPIRADAAQYYMSAYNLVFHGIYSQSLRDFSPDPNTAMAPDSIRYPGLPLVLSTLIWANSRLDRFGTPQVNTRAVYHGAQLVNVIAGVAAVGLVFFAARVALPLWAALGAALLTAISPHLVSYTVYMLTEPISVMLTCLLLAAVAAVASAGERMRRLGPFVGIGLIVGALAMFRPIYLLSTPAGVLAFVGRRGLHKALVGALIGTALAVAPWFVRNTFSVPAHQEQVSVAPRPPADVHPAPVLAGDRGAVPNPAQTDPASGKVRADTPSALQEIVGRGATVFGNRADSKIAGSFREIAYRFAVDPLGAAAWYGFGTLRRLWQWDNVDGAGDVYIYPVTKTPFTANAAFRVLHDGMKGIHWVIVGLALVGSIFVWLPGIGDDLLARRGRPVLRAASLLLAYTTITLIPFYTCTRYAVPVFPALFLMAMVPLAIAVQLAARRVPACGSILRPDAQSTATATRGRLPAP